MSSNTILSIIHNRIAKLWFLAIGIFFVLCLSSTSVWAFDVGDEITVTDIVNDPNGVFNFIDDEIDYLEGHFCYVDEDCWGTTTPSLEDKANYLRHMASNALYSFLTLRYDPYFATNVDSDVFDSNFLENYILRVQQIESLLITVLGKPGKEVQGDDVYFTLIENGDVPASYFDDLAVRSDELWRYYFATIAYRLLHPQSSPVVIAMDDGDLFSEIEQDIDSSALSLGDLSITPH